MLPGRQKRRGVEVKNFQIWTLLSAKEHFIELSGLPQKRVACRPTVLCTVTVCDQLRGK